jgi:hypothetical protein
MESLSRVSRGKTGEGDTGKRYYRNKKGNREGEESTVQRFKDDLFAVVKGYPEHHRA